MSETPILNRTNVKFKEIGILFAIYSSKRKEDRAKGKDGVSHRLIPSHNLHFSHSRGNIKMLNWNVEEKKKGRGGRKGFGRKKEFVLFVHASGRRSGAWRGVRAAFAASSGGAGTLDRNVPRQTNECR